MTTCPIQPLFLCRSLLGRHLAALLVILFAFLPAVMRGQDSASGVSVRITAEADGFRTASYYLRIVSASLLMADSAALPLDLNPHGVGTSHNTESKTVRFETGRVYELSVGGLNLAAFDIKFDLPSGYQLEVDGNISTKISSLPQGTFSDLFSVRVVSPSTDFSGRAGVATSIQSGRISWQVALGALANSKSAGALLLGYAGASGDWDAAYTPAALHYEARDGVHPVRLAGRLRQVWAPEACVDVVTLTPSSYELRFYSLARMYGIVNPEDLGLFHGFPYVTYRIERVAGSATKLIITSETRDITMAPVGTTDDAPLLTSVMGVTNAKAPIKRTARTSIERVGSGSAAVWTLQDWNTIDATQLVEETRTGAALSDGRREVVVVRQPGGLSATQTTRIFKVLPVF